MYCILLLEAEIAVCDFDCVVKDGAVMTSSLGHVIPLVSVLINVIIGYLQ